MPAAADRHVHSSISRSTTHVLLVLFQRLKRANLPLLIAFVSALFMFLRALSGAGYIDPNSELTPVNYTHLTSDHAYIGFAEHWARFKDMLLSCPEETENGSGDTSGVVDDGSGTVLDSDGELGDVGVTTAPTTTRRVGVKCLGERLSGAIGFRRPNSSVVKQEDRAFGISLDGIPSRRKGDAAPNREPSNTP